MLDFVFSCYFTVPLNGRLLYYFPHILAEYNNWINILHIFILRFVPKKCGLQGYPAPNFFSGSSWWSKYFSYQSWRKKKFCLTLGQTGTGVLSDPWPLCLSHHFFVILYITCHILFFYTELNARLPIVMIIKQLN
jgi:hypothetical protein